MAIFWYTLFNKNIIINKYETNTINDTDAEERIIRALSMLLNEDDL